MSNKDKQGTTAQDANETANPSNLIDDLIPPTAAPTDDRSLSQKAKDFFKGGPGTYAKGNKLKYFGKPFEVTLVHPDGALDLQEVNDAGEVVRFGKDLQPNWLHRVDPAQVEAL